MNVYAKARDSPVVVNRGTPRISSTYRSIETVVQIHQPESYWDIKLNYLHN